jgi:hypothetical protein
MGYKKGCLLRRAALYMSVRSDFGHVDQTAKWGARDPPLLSTLLRMVLQLPGYRVEYKPRIPTRSEYPVRARPGGNQQANRDPGHFPR